MQAFLLTIVPAFRRILSMNWKNGILHLLSVGVSVRDIADATGLSVSSVYDIKNGYSTEPRGMSAVKLHALLSIHEYKEFAQ